MSDLELLLAVLLILENAVIMLVGVIGRKPIFRDSLGENAAAAMKRRRGETFDADIDTAMRRWSP